MHREFEGANIEIIGKRKKDDPDISKNFSWNLLSQNCCSILKKKKRNRTEERIPFGNIYQILENKNPKFFKPASSLH